MQKNHSQTVQLALALLFSGSASLGFQIVWTRMATAGIGHELAATMAMVTGLMGGLSLGALLANRITAGANVGKLARRYASIELVIGFWGIASIWLLPYGNHLARNWIGMEPPGLLYWSKAFLVAFAAILPASMGMGATMVLAHGIAVHYASAERIGWVYAVNTFGATVGALATAYILLGTLGFTFTLATLSSLNFLAGALVFFLRTKKELANPVITQRPVKRPPVETRVRSTRLSPAWTLFLTGFLGLSYEILGVRVLSHSLENTIYTFASTLAVYLCGTATGSAFYERSSAKPAGGRSPVNWFALTAFAIVAGGGMLWYSPTVYGWLRTVLGDSPKAVFAAETLVATTVFFIPTFCMGALFAQVARDGLRQGIRSGQLFGINTLGSAAGPILLGLVLFPVLGSKWCLMLIAFGYLGLAPAWSFQVFAGLAAVFIAAIAMPPKLTRLDIPPGGKILVSMEGAMAGVSVVETREGHRVLKVNNRFQMGGTAAAVAEQRHADIPLLLHGGAKNALFLGLGTGITFATATNYPSLRADGVELNRQVAQVMPLFFREPALPPTAFPNLHVFTGDARRFADQLPSRYDVIVADLFHPAQDGAGFLYTLEHFQSLKARLAPGGLICQWLPLYQMNEETFRMIAASFLQVFPNADAWMLRFNVDTPVVGLISSLGERKISNTWVETQLDAPGTEALRDHLRKVSLGDTVRLAGCLFAANHELTMYASGSRLNTDDFPRVIFEAPSHAYKKIEKNYSTLFALMGKLKPDPSDLAENSTSEGMAFVTRINGFIAARNVYLIGLAQESEGEVLAAVDAYIESARISEDFTLGYAQAITIAAALAQPNPRAARELLSRLDAAQPGRGVAGEMLRRLHGGTEP